MRLHVEDVRKALAASDPDLARLWLARLVDQPDPSNQAPPREGALTWQSFLSTLRSHAFRRKKPEERAAYRQATVSALEAPQAEVPLPPRLKAYEILLELWNDPSRRGLLLETLAEVPLVYGPWRGLKRIFKEAEARDDAAVWGLLAARFDAAYSLMGAGRGQGAPRCEVSEATLGYLVRRAWRRLRRLGQSFPALYPDAAAAVLRNYAPDAVRFRDTWVANQIFYHAAHSRTRRVYNTSRFVGHGAFRSLVTQRAFPEAWTRSPRPLLNLLSAAQAEEPRRFAIDLLKGEFRAVLREVEPAWIAGLVEARSAAADDFLVWLLQNVSRFEQAKLRELGLHEAVLKLFDSSSPAAVQFAADYARTHARDLPLDDLVRLAGMGEQLSKLAVDLLSARHPVKEVGLDGWGRLLESASGDAPTEAQKLAVASLGKHFGPSELTPAWFQDRLVGVSDVAREFAHQQLPRLHDVKALGAAYFLETLDRIDPERLSADRSGMLWELRARGAAEWLLAQLKGTSIESIPGMDLGKLLLNPLTQVYVTLWFNKGAAKPAQIPLPLLRAMASRKDWDASDEVRAIRSLPQSWAQQLEYNPSLGEKVREWLRDVRQFAPADLGRDWLLGLLDSGDAHSVEFASDVLIRGFTPSDFAPKTAAGDAGGAGAAAPIAVDLKGASFLFTGKLATMERAGAEEKVLQAGGSNASGVTAKLNYLVIGDEGSPLYGAGRKGSKQLKGEELIAKGAALKIISETAFLQMLAGRPAVADADQSAAGCEALWKMAAGPGKDDAPQATFARKYILRHHPEICLAETDRPVDPGAEVPAAFLTFERVKPLFSDPRKPVRDLALKLAHWEFARWAPPISDLVLLCETPHAEVREFVAKALTAEPTPEHRRYRVDPAVLTPDAVYGFCESRDDGARGLGMQLIQLHPRLQVPDELFRLTESPDRVMRAFVIRILWSLYRDRGVTRTWKPGAPPVSTIGLKDKAAAQKKAPDRGPGPPPKPEKRPAEAAALRAFLRRTLFEIPPARFEKSGAAGDALRKRLRPLPAREAKLALIETLRDAALEDVQFDAVVRPLFEEFRGSRGKSEFSACMVAIARLRARHGAAAGG